MLQKSDISFQKVLSTMKTLRPHWERTGSSAAQRKKHLLKVIFSALKRSDRADGTELEIPEWNNYQLWIFTHFKHQVIKNTENLHFQPKSRGMAGAQQLWEKPDQAVNPWQRAFYIWEVIWFFRADLNLLCCWVIRSGKFVSSLEWGDKSYVDWSPGA